jgi:type IV pilus assembly protein PilW
MKNPNPIPLRHQLGFTLIELMIAMVLNLVLIGGIFALYRGSTETSRAQSAVAGVQESLRFGFEYLSSDIRAASYTGCANVREVKPKMVANPPLANYGSSNPTGTSMSVRGYINGAGWANPSAIVRKDNTDVITVFHSAPGMGVRLSCDAPDSSQTELYADSMPFKIEAGQALMISDCSRADIFRATNTVNVSSAKVTIQHASSKNSLAAECSSAGKLANECKYGSYTCKEGTRVSVMESWTYFVGTNLRGLPSLYRVSDSGQTEELVENISDLRLLGYGLDTNGTRPFVADSFLKTNETHKNTPMSPSSPTWSQVVSVEVEITALSEQKYRLDSTSSSGSPVAIEQSQRFVIGLRNLVQ